MNETLELYYYPECPYCQKVLRVIEVLGVADEIELKDIHADGEALRTLVDVGGKRQVPCLSIDGKPMYESGDIAAWLNQRFAS